MWVLGDSDALVCFILIYVASINRFIECIII